jgi:hypothetical protein
MVLRRRLLGVGPNPSTKDAELIAFRVGEHHPRRVTLPDSGPPSTEGKQAFDFCALIDRTEVGMESVLACLLLRNRHEQQARHSIRSRPDLELVLGIAHDNPAQRLGPPSTKRDRIVSVDDDLLPNEIHVAHSARSVPQADPTATPRQAKRPGSRGASGFRDRRDTRGGRGTPAMWCARNWPGRLGPARASLSKIDKFRADRTADVPHSSSTVRVGRRCDVPCR